MHPKICDMRAQSAVPQWPTLLCCFDLFAAVSEKSPDLNVHLSADGQTALEINWQEGAPVTSVTYTTKFARVYPLATDIISIQYNTTLKVWITLCNSWLLFLC